MYPQSFSPAQQVDFALLLVFVFSAAVLVILTIVTCWFIWRYHHTRNPRPAEIHGNMLAEVLWAVLPFLMVIGLFYFDWTGFEALRTVPDDAMEVKVTARMFSWTFTYEDGKSGHDARSVFIIQGACLLDGGRISRLWGAFSAAPS